MRTVAIGEVRSGDIQRYVDTFRFEVDAEAEKFIASFNKVYSPQGPGIARPARYLIAVNDPRVLR